MNSVLGYIGYLGKYFWHRLTYAYTTKQTLMEVGFMALFLGAFFGVCYGAGPMPQPLSSPCFYFAFCFAMSRYQAFMERRLDRGRGR